MLTGNDGPPYRLVIVDDHKEAVKPLGEWIRTMVPELHLIGMAHDGVTAVEMVRETRPDVVLMDLVFRQGMSGSECTRRILAENPDVRVLAFTGYSEPEGLLQALEAGASGYYLKGSGDINDLLDAIRRVARGEMVIIGGGPSTVKSSPDLEKPAYPWETLSPSEIRMLELAVKSKSTAEICAEMGIKETTYGNYRRAIREKLGVTEWYQAVMAYLYRKLRENK